MWGFLGSLEPDTWVVLSTLIGGFVTWIRGSRRDDRTRFLHRALDLSERAGTAAAFAIEGLRRAGAITGDKQQLIDSWERRVRDTAQAWGFEIQWPAAVASRELFVQQRKAEEAALAATLLRLSQVAEKVEQLPDRIGARTNE